MLRFRPSGLKGRERGDTIVEVMIVLAILGLTLSICYATANRALTETTQAEENSEAVTIAQSQVEAVRYSAASGSEVTSASNVGTNVYSYSVPFCVAPDGSVKTGAGASVQCLSNMPNNNLYTVQDYSCNFDNTSGSPCYIGSDSEPGVPLKCYAANFTVQLSSDSLPCDTFVVQVTWPGIDSSGSDSVTQVYRIHPNE